MVKHYFLEEEHSEQDFFIISQIIADEQYRFYSADNVFSKDSVDYGTFVLLNTILKNEKVSGKVLDIGCGYGVIGIVLAKNFPATQICLTDVNQTAVELSQKSIQLNDVKNIYCIKKSFAYENIDETFDYIVSNPPIKAGKKVLQDILFGAYDHLNSNGKLIFVIKKKFGEDSIKKQLEKMFSAVEILKRDSGYYILKATK